VFPSISQVPGRLAASNDGEELGNTNLIAHAGATANVPARMKFRDFFRRKAP